MNTPVVSRRQIIDLAWPIVLANAATPLLGLVDTAVIGNTGTVSELGAIALGAIIFNFVFWGFGFLRMGTTGFVAQASGREDSAEVRAAAVRALVLAAGLGLGILLLQLPIVRVALGLLGASSEVEGLTEAYFGIRIWAAPASLGVYVVLGSLIGLGKTRHVLLLQVFMNGVNIVLDVLFAGVFDWGVEGIAAGTAIAEWSTLIVGLLIIHRVLAADRADQEPWLPMERVRDAAKAKAMLGANADIMIRTLFLLFGFAWFANQGALFGDTLLAANHVLLQLISMSAYLLDGYAHSTEVLVGRAAGAGRVKDFDAAVRRSTELAVVSALGLALLVLVAGDVAIGVLTDLPAVREIASGLLPLTALYISLSFAAFQLDGIFIGTTRSRDLRNASVISCLAFVVLSIPMASSFGNRGLWLAFVIFVVLRAVALGVRYPGLRASIREGSGRPK